MQFKKKLWKHNAHHEQSIKSLQKLATKTLIKKIYKRCLIHIKEN